MRVIICYVKLEGDGLLLNGFKLTLDHGFCHAQDCQLGEAVERLLLTYLLALHVVAAGGAISRVLAALRLGGSAGVKWRVSGGCDGGVVGGGGHGGGDGGGGVVAGEGVVGDGLRLQTNATRPSQRHGKNKFQCFRYSTSFQKPKDQYLPLCKHHDMH